MAGYDRARRVVMSFYPDKPRGEKAPGASMSDEQAEKARELKAEGYTLQQIKCRLELRCSLMTISRAINEETYRKRR